MWMRWSGGEIEFVAGFHVEVGVPLVEIADGERADLCGCVWVGEELAAECSVARLVGPDLREGDEELLVAGEVRRRGGCGFAGERNVVGLGAQR